MQTLIRLHSGEFSILLEFADTRPDAVLILAESPTWQGPQVHISSSYFTDILIAASMCGDGRKHVPELPTYCQCEPCCERRGRELAHKIMEYKKEQIGL